MNKPAAIYARVSSDRQKENHTIASQIAGLLDYAAAHGYTVPAEWVFQDEGYSGAVLTRPGLETLRDLAAEGQIAAALVYSPDRLSRKYAYQVLLAEEFSLCGVEVIFMKSPACSTPEDQLLVQFQGMIAEYERAQIAERSRRGKRYKAQVGVVNVLSGAPYGYRYVRKSDGCAAYYEVIETEAAVVRMVFEMYTQQGMSINAIARMLNERQIPTRSAAARWERSTVWGMLRNPAYRGKACYGKTELRPRQRITRPLRQRKGLPSRNSANHERPRHEWIEMSVPSLVTEQTFVLAQEQLEKNKHHSPRRTMEPTLLQGMLVCQQCGYALYRSSTRTSKQKLNYYRCIGSDGYRRLKGPVCTNRPVRQDHLDGFVWNEIIRLLDDPALIQAEIDRRREMARSADPLRRREEELRREQARLEKSVDRLISAYQEGLVTLPQLRQRMPEVRKQTQAVESELRSLETAAMGDARYLQIAESLTVFRTKLRARAETLDIRGRQQILRLMVREILVGCDSITIRHSVPVPPSGSGPKDTPSPSSGCSGAPSDPGSLLRSWSHDAPLRTALSRDADDAIFTDTGFEEGLDKTEDTAVCNAGTNERHHNLVVKSVEKGGDVGVNDGAKSFLCVPNGGCDGVMSFATWPEAEASIREMRIEDRAQDLIDRLLAHAVGYSRDTKRAHLFRVGGLRDIDATNRKRFVAVFHELTLKLSQVGFDVLFKGVNRHPVETMGTFIGSDPTPCGPEVVPAINLVDKRMGFDHRFPLACYTFATRWRVSRFGCRFIEPITNWFFVGGHRLRRLLGVQGGIPSLA